MPDNLRLQKFAFVLEVTKSDMISWFKKSNNLTDILIYDQIIS